MTQPRNTPPDPRNLEAYREGEGLTYEQLAERIKVSTARQAHRYAIGEQMPRPEKVLEIIMLTGGAVTAMAMIDQCVEFQAGRRGRGDHQASLDETPDTVTEAQRA